MRGDDAIGAKASAQLSDAGLAVFRGRALSATDSASMA